MRAGLEPARVLNVHRGRIEIARAHGHEAIDVSGKAAELGIDKSTLFRKIRAMGISVPKSDGRYRN